MTAFSAVTAPGGWAGVALLIVWATIHPTLPAEGQELSPRAYWPAPRGTRVLTLGYAYSSGDVVVDPSLPIIGVESDINKLQVGFVQTVSLAGRTANLVLEIPAAWGTTIGTLDGAPVHRDFSGLGDVAGTLSINLRGAPSMSPHEYRELVANPRPILAGSLKLVAPTGHYDSDRLVNVGANRWAAKVELGQITPLTPRLHLELELGAWFFGDNDHFLGRTREQDPIYAVEAHLVRRFRPGRWASLEVNYFTGGRTSVDGQEHDDLQRNSTIGGTLVWALKGRHAIRCGVNSGIVTESGGDFVTATLSYLVRIN